jgi:hypothetical protein
MPQSIQQPLLRKLEILCLRLKLATMRCDHRGADTAKFSPTARAVQASRVDRLLDRLRRLHERALSYAPPDTTSAIVSAVPVPEFPRPDNELLHTGSSTVPTTGEQGCVVGHDSPLEHPLWLPHSQTLPARLESYLDALEMIDNTERWLFWRLDVAQAFFSALSFAPLTACRQTHRKSSTLSTMQAVLSCVLRNYDVEAYPVSRSQLVKLEQHIQEVARFKTYLAQSLDNVREAMVKRSERHRRAVVNSSTTQLRKGFDLGSPLIEVISADEEWPDCWHLPASSRSQCRLVDDGAKEGESAGCWDEPTESPRLSAEKPHPRARAWKDVPW